MKSSTKEWGDTRAAYEASEGHIAGCEQCKNRPSYFNGRCDAGIDLHAEFHRTAHIARESQVDGRKNNVGTGRKAVAK
jgi:hypothetical protein